VANNPQTSPSGWTLSRAWLDRGKLLTSITYCTSEHRGLSLLDHYSKLDSTIYLLLQPWY